MVTGLLRRGGGGPVLSLGGLLPGRPHDLRAHPHAAGDQRVQVHERELRALLGFRFRV